MQGTRAQRALVAATALSAALLLGGCSAIDGILGSDTGGTDAASAGGDAAPAGGEGAPAGGNVQDRSAEEILASAEAAYQAASSVRVSGSLSQGGLTMGIDLQLSRDGNAQVAVTQDAGTVELIRIADQTWVRAQGMLPPEAAQVIGDRWILVTPETTGATGGLTQGVDQLASMDQFGSSFFSTGFTFEKVEGEPVGGLPTVGLRDSEGSTLYVAAEGEPYPLLVTPGPNEDQAQRVEFSGYNEQLAITPPADAIESIESLLGG